MFLSKPPFTASHNTAFDVDRDGNRDVHHRSSDQIPAVFDVLAGTSRVEPTGEEDKMIHPDDTEFNFRMF